MQNTVLPSEVPVGRQMSITIPNGLYEDVQMLAKENNISIYDLAREALYQYVKPHRIAQSAVVVEEPPVKDWPDGFDPAKAGDPVQAKYPRRCRWPECGVMIRPEEDYICAVEIHGVKLWVHDYHIS